MSESTPVLAGLSKLARHLFVARTTVLITDDDGNSHVVVANLHQVAYIAVEVYLNQEGDPERLVYELDGCQGPTLHRWRNPDLIDRTAGHLVGRLRRERKLFTEDRIRIKRQQRWSGQTAA